MRLIIILLLLLPSVIYAGTDYKCTITNMVSPDENGELKKRGYGNALGAIFTVDRTTGNTAGYLKNNRHAKPKVIHRGSKDTSFKAVSISANVDAIIVEEFSEHKQKPFIFLSDLWVFYGTCVHF